MKLEFRLVIWISALCLGLIICQSGFAQATRLSLEDRVKAAFLYKFCHYIEWPETAFSSANAPVIIAVVGADAIAHELEKVTVGHDIKGRSIKVKSYTPDRLPQQAHLLFISRAASTQHPDWLKTYSSKPVMLVTDSPNGLDLGSGINFLVDGDRVRFDISLTTIKAQQLRIGSPLLSVARQIRGAEK
ncbi:MAG: YfiR family protein [Methylophaga sp.]